jgi:hypothetical protein
VHALARDRGIPDPNSQGQFVLSIGPGSDMAPNNPAFPAAEAACQSLQPAGGTQAQQQQNYAALLKYAHCMQSHGVSIPDPPPPGSGPATKSNSSGNGGLNSGSSGGVNPNSPQFIGANKACQQYLPAGGQGPVTSSGGGS